MVMVGNAPPPRWRLGIVGVVWPGPREPRGSAVPGAASATATGAAAGRDRPVVPPTMGEAVELVPALMEIYLGERPVPLETPVLVFEPVGHGGPVQHRVLPVLVAVNFEQHPIVLDVVERNVPVMARHVGLDAEPVS